MLNNSEVYDVFACHIKNIKKTGTDQYIGKCPFHNDGVNSISFNTDKQVFKCFAGCNDGDLADFVGLIGDDPKPYYKKNQDNNELLQIFKPKIDKKIKPKPKAILDAKNDKMAKKFHKFLLNNWSKTDIPEAWNKETIEKTETGYDNKNKRFTFLHTNEIGLPVNIRYHKSEDLPPQSISGHGSTTLFPLHILSEYNKNKKLILCEGEKDVISLLSMGLQAVTITNGAGSIPQDINPLLQFKEIIICYDNDDAGINGSNKVAKILHEADAEIDIKILTWDSGIKGYDITDYINTGKNKENVIKLLSQSKEYPEVETNNDIKFYSLRDAMNDKTPAPPQIINKGILPESAILLLHGSPKSGKSIMACNLALSLSSGIDWYDFEIKRPYKTLVIQAEVNYHEERERFRVMLRGGEYNGSLDNMEFSDGRGIDLLSEKGIKFINEKLIEFNPEIVIIDPLKDYHTKDENSNTDMAVFMQRLRSLVNAFNISIILVHHSKKNNEGFGGSNIRGASNIFGSVDSVIELKKKKNLERTLNFELRYGSELEEMSLELNPMSLFFEQINDLKDDNLEIMKNIIEENDGISKTKLREQWRKTTDLGDGTFYKCFNFLDDFIEKRGKKIYKKEDSFDFPI